MLNGEGRLGPSRGCRASGQLEEAERRRRRAQTPTLCEGGETEEREGARGVVA